MTKIAPDGTQSVLTAGSASYSFGVGPHGIAFTDGSLYVNDAGGNTVYRVNPETGEFSLFAVVPGLNKLTGAGEPGAEGGRQPVPTGIVAAPEGGFYISLLSEGWPAGSPSVLHLAADGTFTPAATDLVMVVAVSTNGGTVYATQWTTDLAREGAPGNIVSVGDAGNQPVLEGLVRPHGTAWDDEDNLYVAVVSINIAPAPPGMVFKCELTDGDGGTPTV